MVEILSPVIDDHRTKILSTYDKIGKFDSKKLQVETLETGIPCFDRNRILTKGQARLITLGAHTSHGKSALLMQIAAHVSKTMSVIVHSFEMSSDEIETRLLAAAADISTTQIQEGGAQEAKLRAARDDYADRKLYVCNIQNRSSSFVTSSIYELAQIIGPVGLVMIDYGQQMKPGGNGVRPDRVVEIGDISASLLQLAQQLKCNVIVGAQLNNEVLKRAWGTQDEEGNREYVPIISDIREGSSIAHDSAAVLVVVRPYVFDRRANKASAHVYCLKHRAGEIWDKPLRWDGQRCKFFEDPV